MQQELLTSCIKGALLLGNFVQYFAQERNLTIIGESACRENYWVAEDENGLYYVQIDADQIKANKTTLLVNGEDVTAFL